MRKFIPAAVFAALFILGIAPGRAEAYTPHYLPGGVNYLSPDNFEQENGYISAIDLFLVKPGVVYCLSVRGVYGGYQDIDVVMDFYQNNSYLSTLVVSDQEMTTVDGTRYYVFTMPSTANYMDLGFLDVDDYFTSHALDEFQLEEGTTPTAWAPYVDGTVADANGPLFAGNAVALSDVDDPLTEAEIRSGLSAYDAIDGDVTAAIVAASDGYTGKEGILGEYDIVYDVTDAAGNTTSFRVTVKVVDVTAPMFGGATTLVVPYPAVLSMAAIRAEVNASDNYDGDLTADITLVSDGYTAHAAATGSYEVVFQATDASGNSATRTVTVQVVDRATPVFSGPASYTIGYDVALSLTDIRSALSVLDDYDGDLTEDIVVATDGYSAHRGKIGVYSIVFRATDASGNATDYTVLVQVVDGIGPIVYVDAAVVRVYDRTVLALSDFTALLVRAGELPDATGFGVTVRFDSYSSHATTPGIYHLALDIAEPGGTTLSKTFQILVSEAPSEYVPGPGDPNKDSGSGLWAVTAWALAGTAFAALLATNLAWIHKMKKR